MPRHNMSNYVYEISSNAPREGEDVTASVEESGVVFVATGLDTGVDDVWTR
jgi:hypothetical protein